MDIETVSMLKQVKDIAGPPGIWGCIIVYVLWRMGAFAKLRRNGRNGNGNAAPGKADICIARGEALAVLKAGTDETNRRLEAIEHVLVERLGKQPSGAKK